MASSSTSSCVKEHHIEETYDVFLSFRGEDTRDTFATYLYEALSSNQFSTFMDDHELESGDEISPKLSKAIEESKISVVIFSQNYASSTWCLNELVQIFECKEKRQQVVVPIFYGVDPSVVRKQEGSFKAAFDAHEERFKDKMEKVLQWRVALTEASNLCGLDSKNFRPENKLIQKIVEDISSKLPKYLTFEEHFKGRLIGIEKHIKEIESLLSFGTKDVRIVGIWGMGGIGKTTIASVVYKKWSYFQFESYYFLWNVREEYLRHGPNYLRKKLMSGLLRDESILRMDTPFVASTFIHSKLRRKKVFIVLDDVDSSIQLEALVEGYDHFALESRIIVTTRNVQVLKKVADEIYKVDGLNKDESLELFNLHAFGKSSPPIDYGILSNKVINYAHGHPLNLKVLGSFLFSKSADEWESAINKLKKIPNKDILDVLRISYEGLDDKGVQTLFLDIACLDIINQTFNRDDVENLLDTGDSSVKIGLTILIDKCLVECRKGNVLWMHDLLRQVGRTIVCDEHKEPGNRSRLWDVRDVCLVLERNKGTAAVESISLNMSEISRDIKVSNAAFSEMYNLRILKIYYLNIDDKKFKLHLSEGLGSYLSDKIRYLQWDLYPLKSLPSNFSPENLVELILRGSHVHKLWSNHEVKSLPILRRMDLSYSKFLTQLPDLSQAPNLESINLEGCASLVQVLSSIQNLDKLTYLNLRGCSKLRDLKEISRSTWGYKDLVMFGGIKNQLSSIYQLDFSFLKSFITNSSLYSTRAHISQKIPMNLTELILNETPIEALPPTIGYDLSRLVFLSLRDCTRLKAVPPSICHMKSLKSLLLYGCKNLKTFPEISESMEHLTNLWLNYSGIKGLPESIEKLVSLRFLYIEHCKELESLPSNLCRLRKLEWLMLDYCSRIESLPPLPPTLIALSVNQCERLKSLPLSKWWATPTEDVDSIFSAASDDDSIDFHGCQSLDQNTCTSMLSDSAVFQILSHIYNLFADQIGPDCNAHHCIYPGDEIPSWFTYKSGWSAFINSILLPPSWNNENFLGFAFCIVLDIKEDNAAYRAHCELNFTTFDGHQYKYHDYSERLWHSDVALCSHQVVMWYVEKRSLQSREEIMDGLNWPSACGTEASFYVFLHFDNEDGIVNSQIKRFGIRFVRKQDIERFDAETAGRKNKRRFNECCESRGSKKLKG